MLHLATSSPCSRSEIYAFDNKSKENSTFCHLPPKDRHQRSPGNVTFPTSKSIRQASFKGWRRGILKCAGEWESLLPRPNLEDQMSTGGRAEGRANGTENAVLILISAHVGKNGKTAKPKAVNVKGEQRKILVESKKGRFVGRLGCTFCGAG